MADTDVRVIDVKLQGLDDNIRSMLDLKKYIKQTTEEIKMFEATEKYVKTLEKTMASLNRAGQANSKQYIEMSKKLEENRKWVKQNEQAYIDNQKVLTESNQILKTQKYEIGEVIRVQNQQKGSIVELRAQEKLLQEEYINLSRIQRNGLEGEALRNSLRATREEIRQASMAAGDFRTNVGNYSASIQDAVKSMGGFGKVGQEVTGGMNAIKMASTGVLGVCTVFRVIILKNLVLIRRSIVKRLNT